MAPVCSAFSASVALIRAVDQLPFQRFPRRCDLGSYHANMLIPQ